MDCPRSCWAEKRRAIHWSEGTTSPPLLGTIWRAPRWWLQRKGNQLDNPMIHKKSFFSWHDNNAHRHSTHLNGLNNYVIIILEKGECWPITDRPILYNFKLNCPLSSIQTIVISLSTTVFLKFTLCIKSVCKVTKAWNNWTPSPSTLILQQKILSHIVTL